MSTTPTSPAPSRRVAGDRPALAEGRCRACGLSRGEAACVREYEEWRRRYGWALARKGFSAYPFFPPAERGVQHDQLCPLGKGSVLFENEVGGMEVGRLARCWRWLCVVAFPRSRKA